jgi:hypothetical protein
MVRSAMKIGIRAFTAVAALALAARAEPAGRLSYERGAGAEFCPDEVALRRAIAARLGEDPFLPSLPRLFRLTLVASSGRLRGTVELVTNGVTEGRRELDGDAEACAELVEAMALAVSLAINPNLVVEDAPAPPAREEAPPPATPVVGIASPRQSPTRDMPRTGATGASKPAVPVRFAAGLAAHGAVGTGPGIAAGGSAVVRTGRGWWQAGLEGRVDALSRAGIGRNGTVHSTLVAAVLAPCARLGQVSGCPLFLAGSMFAHSRGVTRRRSDSGFFAAVGGRLAATAPLGEHLLLEARLDALYPLTPVTIDLDGTPVWRARASGALGVGVLWEFP